MYKVEDKILLADDLCPFIESGEKEVTIRKGKRIFAPELVITNRDTGKNYLVDVLSVEYGTLAECHEDVLKADGFDSVEQAVEDMKRFYPDITENTPITVVRFQLRQPESV